MALKHGSSSETRRKKVARGSDDNPFTAGPANSPGKRPGPKSPGGHRRAEVPPRSGAEAKPVGAKRTTGVGQNLETKGHAERRERTRNPPKKKTMPLKARRAPGNR